MAQLKKLHIGNKLEDLEKLTIIPDARNKSMKILLNTAHKLFLTAEDYHLKGDQELAYISYMKYFNMLSIIHKKSDYAKHKTTVRDVLGDTDSNRRIMDTLELISDSLAKRYEVLHPVNTNSSPPFISPSAAVGELHRSDEPSSRAATEAFATLGVISCSALFQRMQEKSVLVMDCRSSSDYERSHLTYYCAFNVPEELIMPGMSAGKLQARLSSSAKASWASRSVKESVVLMDWVSKDAQPADGTAIATLLDILKNWDPDVTYRSPIQILEGGYQQFIMMYPTHCTNPSVQRPQQINNVIDTIDDIEYPSISDITMKEDIMYADDTKIKQRPSINRANKPTTLRNYEPVQQNHQLPEPPTNPINEIITHQTELLKRAEQNDMLLENASKKWRSLQAQGGIRTEVEQELLYNLMQLESKAEDYKTENSRLRDMVNQYKNESKHKDLETTKQIESKIEERQKLDEHHALERMEREHQLAIARETKRFYKPPTDPAMSPAATPSEESSPSSLNEPQQTISFDQPAINSRPLYDRGTKPRNERTTAISTVEADTPRVRDFSPVIGQNVGRGLTGLKNLGNTCYMNSILQCLSNTPQLMEFCVTDKYKKFISRQNKTNGQVIEEVAALLKELWNGQYKCVASRDLRYVVGQYQKIFRGVDQQDSHEFLTILMDWLHSDLQTLNVPPKEVKRASEKAWLEFTKSQESLILHLFYGQIKSTVKCVTCNMESATYECFSNLSMELPPNTNFCHLSQCMDMYFSGEKINGWNCPNCKTKRDAIKKLDISKLPPVLVVHLKRFYADPGNTSAYIKKQNYLQFPLENMDMKPYIARAESRTQTPKVYQLYAVSNHYGTMEGGHYTAFCKSANYGRWYKFDDQVVSTLDSSNVVSSAAYILFYTWLPPMHQLA